MFPCSPRYVVIIPQFKLAMLPCSPRPRGGTHLLLRFTKVATLQLYLKIIKSRFKLVFTIESSYQLKVESSEQLFWVFTFLSNEKRNKIRSRLAHVPFYCSLSKLHIIVSICDWLIALFVCSYYNQLKSEPTSLIDQW